MWPFKDSSKKQLLPFDEAEVQSEEAKEEGFESLVREEDFEVFYRPNVTEDTETTSTLVAITISTD